MTLKQISQLSLFHFLQPFRIYKPECESGDHVGEITYK